MVTLLALLAVAGATVPTGIEGLRRSSTDVSPLESRAASFTDISVPTGAYSEGGNKVLIVVADYVASPLAAQIAQLQSDITSEGWNAVVQSMAGGTAEDLRALFQSTPDLDGAILIGFLPCAWFEEDYWASEEFPCELFLMDLDGIWTDTDGNGLYDSHTGDVAPEIWLGRIDAHAMDFGSELLMLSEYLQKNHLYRTGAMAPPSRALTYIDDDWSYSYSSCGLNAIYGPSGVTVVNSDGVTTAENYLDRLEEGYEFVHLMAHSSPWGHTFKIPGGMAGTVMAPEIAQLNPSSAFLQLFSCSNARWVETGCLGNWYLFGTDTGLLVSGAAKTGSMLDFEYFYGPVGAGATFGEAFQDWWQHIAAGGFSSYERAWFYGNALLGDPTLKPITASFAGTPADDPGTTTSAFAVSTSLHSDCFPDAATHEDITAVAWLTGENGRLDIAARFYDDGSDSWSQVYIVDEDEYWDNAVSVCFDDSGVPWLAWSDFEYANYSYRVKTASGMPFENVQVAVPQDGYQVSPSLACTDVVWLAWQDWEATGGRIMAKTLQGTSFQEQLSAQGAWASAPSISEGPGGGLHAVWVENSPGGSSIMWTTGDTGGFQSPIPISTGTFCHSPDIDLHQGNLVAVWQSDGLTSSVVSRTWNGSQWLDEEEIWSTTGHLMNPRIGSDPSGTPVTVWQQGRVNGSAWASVWESGEWSAPFQPVTSGGPVWNPVLSGGRYFWAGTEGGNWDIYCQTTTGVHTEPAPAARPEILSNPVRGSLLIGLPSVASPFSGRVLILDITGRVVLETRADIPPGGTGTIDCSSLATGVYSLLTVDSGNPEKFTLLR